RELNEPREVEGGDAKGRVPRGRRAGLGAVPVHRILILGGRRGRMPEPTVLVTDLAFGVLLGCVFAVIAHGLNLIWGVAKVVNVAHGVFIMLGAYGAYFLNLWFGFNPLLSVPVDAAIGLAVGLGFYFGFLHRELRGKESMGLQSEMVTLVATFGLSLVLINAVQTLWTGNNVGIPWSRDVV